MTSRQKNAICGGVLFLCICVIIIYVMSDACNKAALEQLVVRLNTQMALNLASASDSIKAATAMSYGESAKPTGQSDKRIRPLKGRPFQELVDLSEELNDILFCTKLIPEQRAERLLAKGAPMAYADLLEMAQWIDYCKRQQCDAPCFAAIQDSIIRSATDETIDVYWYYEVRGQDSVLMFDMESYKRGLEWEASSHAQANIDEWNKRADMETENAERIFSADMKYAVYISTHPNPIFRDEVIAGETEGCSIYRNGICLIDRQSGTSRQIVAPGQDPIKENIANLIWNLESNVIYFMSYGDTAGSADVYSCNIFTAKVDLLSGGNLVELILDEPYIGYLKILNSCFIEGQGGRYWYYAALSPDGKTEIRLTEPSMDIPKDF